MAKAQSLVQIQPYRSESLEPVAVRVETANCYWCRWRADSYKFHNITSKKHAPIPGWCMRPEQMGKSRDPDYDLAGACIDWNRNGDCLGYEVTALTIILRIFGIRRRAWRMEVR